MRIGEFAEAVAQYCLLAGASETSGGRTDEHNRKVGGVPYSAHRFFRGRDVVYDYAIALPERRELAHRLGLMLIAEDDHDHLQPADWPRG